MLNIVQATYNPQMNAVSEIIIRKFKDIAQGEKYFNYLSNARKVGLSMFWTGLFMSTSNTEYKNQYKKVID